MNFNEQAYITLCKAQIEKKFAFGNGNGYTQRDLELLAQHIEEKTGINLSLSTLKRFWKGHFKQSPQIATLNALAMVLDYKNWQDFKLQNQPPNKHSATKILWILPILTLLVVVGIIIMPGLIKKQVKVTGPIHFSTQKTVTSGIPNTVIFNYDLSNVEADSFFIQQSWNNFHRMAIDPNATTHTSIYYESGYHRARLYANDSMIAMQPVHILSDGWEPHIYYSYADQQPINFKNENFIENGQLHLKKELLNKRNIDFSRYFLTRISNTRDFGVSSNNFSLLSRIKVDSLADKLCPWMQMMVVTEKHVFWVNLQNKGCEHNASYKMGEVIRSGQQNDLSPLGVNIYKWQDVGVIVQNKQVEISLNDKVVFQETYQEDFGNVMGLLYIFDGTGSLDYVRLANANGKTVFEDDFTFEKLKMQ
ncbi:hypothetical protein QQ008_12905 [Fulvivirgaceae bacterium BMA10]|uniref:Uncharacterized protein n=1 Tax=Splendidivirga corallicola TaxID=3051826 RepID=A0ABT8KQJ4_9BACT|nr:hypothetical protein [Fulvivirgaceae bacterium BMA10]